MDITMCKGTNCPLNESCYRYTANANELYQSYFADPPFKDGKCEMYWGQKANSIYNEIKNILKDEKI